MKSTVERLQERIDTIKAKQTLYREARQARLNGAGVDELIAMGVDAEIARDMMQSDGLAGYTEAVAVSGVMLRSLEKTLIKEKAKEAARNDRYGR